MSAHAIEAPDAACCLKPIYIGHAHVHQNKVEVGRGDHRNRFEPTLGVGDLVAGSHQEGAGDVAVHGDIVHDQQAQSTSRH